MKADISQWNPLEKIGKADRKALKRGGKATQRGLSHDEVPVFARDRAGATMDCVLKARDMTALSVALKPFLMKDVLLCTDGSKAFAGAARKLGIEQHAVNRHPRRRSLARAEGQRLSQPA